MSDRRPSKPRPLFAGCPTHPEHADRKHDYMGNVSNYGDPCSFQIEPATVDDALAAVRRGVESGTIKGEVDRWCVEHRLPLAPGWNCCLSQMWTGAKATCEVVDAVIVIGPVSDGGSET